MFPLCCENLMESHAAGFCCWANMFGVATFDAVVDLLQIDRTEERRVSGAKLDVVHASARFCAQPRCRSRLLRSSIRRSLTFSLTHSHTQKLSLCRSEVGETSPLPSPATPMQPCNCILAYCLRVVKGSWSHQTSHRNRTSFPALALAWLDT